MATSDNRKGKCVGICHYSALGWGQGEGETLGGGSALNIDGAIKGTPPEQIKEHIARDGTPLLEEVVVADQDRAVAYNGVLHIEAKLLRHDHALAREQRGLPSGEDLLLFSGIPGAKELLRYPGVIFLREETGRVGIENDVPKSGGRWSVSLDRPA